jgi:uncharacterized linocin/CFP29 family protein
MTAVPAKSGAGFCTRAASNRDEAVELNVWNELMPQLHKKRKLVSLEKNFKLTWKEVDDSMIN